MENDKKNSKISNNPSTRHIKALLPGLQALAKGASSLGKLGIKRDQMKLFTDQIADLVEQSKIIDLPDRFNEIFGALGWITVGSALSVDVMKEAISLHNAGRIDEAEMTLVEWFTKDNIELFAILRARRFHQAALRDDQLKEALKLYLEERYMAAVPLILIACDGFASDVAPVSPFEKDADLGCFDSITGHSTALPALMKLITKGVRKSRDDVLNLPLRHGILHGRSLGYANKKVCAKAWLLMMALVDWAIDKASEDERIEKYEQKQRETFADALDQHRKLRADKKVIEAFKPYDVVLPFGAPLDLNGPENVATEFLSGWQAKNYGRMAKHAVNRTQKPDNKMAGEMRQMAEYVELLAYEFRSFRHTNVARCDVRIWAKAKTLTKDVEGEFDLLLLRFTSKGDIAMPNDKDGRWCVQQLCIYNVMNEKFADERKNQLSGNQTD